jgi:hypothetical protein
MESIEEETTPAEVSTGTAGTGTATHYATAAPPTVAGRPRDVFIVALIYTLLAGALLLLVLMLAIYLVPFFGPDQGGSGPFRGYGGPGAIAAVVGVVVMIGGALMLAIPLLFAALGVWSQRRFGLVPAFFASFLLLVTGVGSLYGVLTSPGGGGLFGSSGILSLLALVAALYTLYFLFKPSFRQQFR